MEEIIEQYLLGQLSKEEKAAFEQRINTEPNLAKEVKIQRELMEAIKIQGLKADISNAWQKVRIGKMLKNGFIAVLAAAILGLGIYYVTKTLQKDHIDYSEVGASLPTNLFEIDNTRDTVVETANGIILHIPTNAFGDITDYELEIKEALNALDIMEAGLSTMADSNLLATAGMFKITATKDGVELQLADGKEITAQVPTDEVDPDIMLFDGVEDSTGNINWVNPTKIKKHLITRSFDELNFYPPGYLAKVTENGYDASNKQYTDSLYWSFDCGVETVSPEPIAVDISDNTSSNHAVDAPIYTTTDKDEQKKQYLSYTIINRDLTNQILREMTNKYPSLYNEVSKYFVFDEATFNINFSPSYDPELNQWSQTNKFIMVSDFEKSMLFDYPPKPLTDSLVSDPDEIEETVDTEATHNEKICPASIKALQTKRFAKTYIATKEFEQRLQHLFEICDESSLNIYIANLDKDICYADSIVASKMSGAKKEIFERFASQKLGNTKSASPAFAKLAAYHKKKKNAYDDAAGKAREKVLNKYAKEDADKQNRDTEKATAEMKDRVNVYQKELKTNLKEAYRQAGLPYPNPPATKGTYIVPITTTGWKNLDQYVTESTDTRTSLKTTYNGKDISIEYNPLSVQIENEDEYDFVRVYLIANKLPSYQKMKKKEAVYSESLNELFDYELVCLAKKGSAYFVYTDLLQKKDDTKAVTLRSINKKELKKLLESMNRTTANRNVADDLEYEEQNFLYNQNLKKRENDEALRREIEGIIWPCRGGLSCNEEIVREGEMLFVANCASCHALKNKVVGPALAGVIDKYEEDYDWLIAFTQNYQKLIKSGDVRANAIYEEYNGAAMNIFENLSDDQILSIYSYIDCISGSVPRVPSPPSPKPEILKTVNVNSKESSLSDIIESITKSTPILPLKVTKQDTADQITPTTFAKQTQLQNYLKSEYPSFYEELANDFDLDDPTFHASFKVNYCNFKKTPIITASGAEKAEQYEIDMSNTIIKSREFKKFFELCALN